VLRIESNVVAKSITFDDYMQCLFDKIEMTRKQLCIRSNDNITRGVHDIRNKNRSKYDDKRYIVPDSITLLL